MKARLITFLLLLTVMMIAVPQVLALEILVNNQGVINFYDDHVLGRNTDSVSPTSTSKPIRIVPVSENKQIYIKPGIDETTVELRELPHPNRRDFTPTETMKTDQVEMTFPAQLTDYQLGVAKEKRAQAKESSQGYLQELRESRQERHLETVQVKNKGVAGQNMLELRSRNITAILKNGAQFQLDPATNEVIITTPSGQKHILNHLPDQAIDRMFNTGFFSGEEGVTEEKLEIGTNDWGDLIYIKRDKINKKLFGIFPRKIDSKIILNDATGEVTEEELVSDSVIEQFLNAVSF